MVSIISKSLVKWDKNLCFQTFLRKSFALFCKITRANNFNGKKWPLSKHFIKIQNKSTKLIKKMRNLKCRISFFWFLQNGDFRYYHAPNPMSQLHNHIRRGACHLYCATCVILAALKNQYRKFVTNIPRKGIVRPQSQFPHSCICERFIYSIPTIDLPILLQEICGPILAIYKTLSDTWTWKSGLRPRKQFPEKEYLNGIFVALCHLVVIFRLLFHFCVFSPYTYTYALSGLTPCTVCVNFSSDDLRLATIPGQVSPWFNPERIKQ